MPKSARELDELAQLLERTGGDPERIEAVRRVQKFRRSWIELAEFLCEVRRSRVHERWGFADFHAYCSEELTLKRATVDKLTISFSTLKSHAPQVLKWDGVAKTIPSYEAIDYFSKAVGKSAADQTDDRPPPRPSGKGTIDDVSELSAAVFDDATPVRELRKRFDNVFFPQPRAAGQLGAIQKASAAARRLAEVLPDIQGLADSKIRRIEGELGSLRQRLEELALPLKEKVARAKKRSEKERHKEPAESA
ncbi:MAG: hypothetical protein V3V08_20040 [Nannocystaceae bacterium]